MATNAGTLTIYTNVDKTGLNAGISSITKSMHKLASTMKMTLGIVGLMHLGKSAIDAASDLQEYNNVAEVTFGNLIYKLDELTETSIQAYGMSRLTATQAASGFMAMGNAAGIAKEEASDMAIKLTEYMGDFASFYNIAHESARTALAAVYTGETETLKQYGIMLQEVNLQQYENTYGLGRSVKTMSAAEKAQLRYNYIMHVGKDAMGDFVRTSDQWANQVRVLKEQWTELLIKLGSGLITVLTPLIKVMNQLIAVTMDYMDVLGDAISVIFGIEWQDLAEQRSASTESTESATDAEEEYADAVNKSAKSANKALQSFDKLNVIRTTKTSAGIEVDVEESNDIIDKAEKTKDKVESAIDTLYKLGQFLGTSLVNTLNKIDWTSVYQKFTEFGKGVADYMNGLFSTESLSSVVVTLVNTLNAVVRLATEFLSTLDWTQLGEAIADAINDGIDNLDMKRIGEFLNRLVDGIKELLLTIIKKTDWSAVLDSVKDLFSVLEIDTITLTVGAILIPKLAKLIGTSLYTAICGKTMKLGVGKAFATLFSGGLLGTTDLLGKLADAIALTVGGAGTLKESLTVMFGATATTLSGVFSIITGALSAIFNFVDMLKNGFSWIKEILMVIGIAITAIGAVVLGVVTGPVAAAIAAVVAAIMTLVVVIKDNWAKISQFFVNLWNSIAGIFTGVYDWVNSKVLQPTIKLIQGFIIRVKQFVEGLVIIIAAVTKLIVDGVKKHLIDPLVEKFAPIGVAIVACFSYAWNKATKKWGEFCDFIKTHVTEPVEKAWSKFTTWLSESFTKQLAVSIGGAVIIVNGLLELIEQGINNIINDINTLIEGFNDVAQFSAGILGTNFTGISLIPNVSLGRVSIPKLATGAVIPPNKEFMAILGDQKHGTNIEAPLDTIKQALAEVMADFGGNPNNGDIVVQIDGREVFRAVRRQNTEYINRTGSSAFAY